MIAKENANETVSLTFSKEEMGLLFAILTKIGGHSQTTPRGIIDQWTNLLQVGCCMPKSNFVNVDAFTHFRNSTRKNANVILFKDDTLYIPKLKNESDLQKALSVIYQD